MRDSTWPEAFGQAGYTTFVSGKWHNGDASLARSFQHARSMFTGGMTNPMQAKLRNVVDGKVGEAKPTPHHACQVFADETIRFLQEHKDGPFFAYLPFEHSETLLDQERSVALFAGLRREMQDGAFDNAYDYALRHREVIARFGRFPHRNAILGRASNAEEIEFLSQPGSSF